MGKEVRRLASSRAASRHLASRRVASPHFLLAVRRLARLASRRCWRWPSSRPAVLFTHAVPLPDLFNQVAVVLDGPLGQRREVGGPAPSWQQEELAQQRLIKLDLMSGLLDCILIYYRSTTDWGLTRTRRSASA